MDQCFSDYDFSHGKLELLCSWIVTPATLSLNLTEEKFKMVLGEFVCQNILTGQGFLLFRRNNQWTSSYLAFVESS